MSNNLKENQIGKTIITLASEYWPCFLIVLAIIGFISKSFYNYPMAVMAIIGLYRFIKSPNTVIQDSTQKLFIISFLCFWLPLLFSFPDAVNYARSSQTIFPYLRFLFAGLFIIQELSKNKKYFNFVIGSVFFIVLFWCMDAAIQFFFGKNLVGYPYRKGDITGMFYPRNRIAHICAILSPLYFIYIFNNKTSKKITWLALIPLFFILLLSGRRAAWLMLALSSIGFFIYYFLQLSNKKVVLKAISFLSLILGLILASTILLHEPTKTRFKVTMGLFSGDYETIDIATARRLPLWETAYDIFKSNPINGIGPRGFRFVFHDYAQPDNYWYNDSAQTHPHLLFLEIMTETGLIGVLGYLIFVFVILKTLYNSKNNWDNLPLALPVLIAIFPINAHMAFYGSIWSTMIWWLTAFYFAYLRLINNETPYN